MIEDATGEGLPCITTVVHDAVTGTLVVSGESLQYVCFSNLTNLSVEVLCHHLSPCARRTDAGFWLLKLVSNKTCIAQSVSCWQCPCC